MKILIAPDSFKESISASGAARAIRKGIMDASPSATVLLTPMADGGEGTVDAVVSSAGGRYIKASVPGPLGRTVNARFGLLDGGACAVIEMAAASGLDLLADEERNPLLTSTTGTGSLLKSAMDRNVRRIVVGVGGSATVDCGIGMASELGFRFLDSQGKEIKEPAGASLIEVDRIETGDIDPRVADTEIIVACDVNNPLTGPGGAARIYAPQKGADSQTTRHLEKALDHFAGVIKRDLKIDVSTMPGGGAAGGLGAGLVAFTGARLESGIETVINIVGLESKMKDCDLVITGEGKVDLQSSFGKAPAGIAKLAKKLEIPVVILAGKLGDGYREIYSHGVIAAFCISDGPADKKDAFSRTPELLRQTAEAVTRLLSCSGGVLKTRSPS